jgi:hypothetical protein
VAREAHAPFDAAPAIVVEFGAITLSTSSITKLCPVDDERRQAKWQQACGPGDQHVIGITGRRPTTT